MADAYAFVVPNRANTAGIDLSVWPKPKDFVARVAGRPAAQLAMKAELIRDVTQLLADVLDKSPATTFVVIDEVAMEDWGIGGLPVEAYRASLAAARE